MCCIVKLPRSSNYMATETTMISLTWLSTFSNSIFNFLCVDHKCCQRQPDILSKVIFLSCTFIPQFCYLLESLIQQEFPSCFHIINVLVKHPHQVFIPLQSIFHPVIYRSFLHNIHLTHFSGQ